MSLGEWCRGEERRLLRKRIGYALEVSALNELAFVRNRLRFGMTLGCAVHLVIVSDF